MPITANLLRRPSDRGLFPAATVLFPLLVLVGYFKSYHFSAFFDVKPVANALVRARGVVMTLWVVYFTAQVALIRSKNVRLHMKLREPRSRSALAVAELPVGGLLIPLQSAQGRER